MKSNKEAYYELLSQQMFGIDQMLNALVMNGIYTLEEYERETQELEQLQQVVQDLKNRYDERRAEAYKERVNG